MITEFVQCISPSGCELKEQMCMGGFLSVCWDPRLASCEVLHYWFQQALTMNVNKAKDLYTSASF